jgi:hypothetical protein
MLVGRSEGIGTGSAETDFGGSFNFNDESEEANVAKG